MVETFKSPIVGEAEKWPQLPLSPRQAKEWEDTKTAVLYSYGAFGGILYKMMVTDNGEKAWFTDQIRIAATDDKVLYLNPNTFFAYPLKKRIFIICHEVFHAMLNHCGVFYMLRKKGKIVYPDGKVLPYVEDIMQIAADCVINANLVFCRVGELDRNWYHKPYLIPHTTSIIDAYRVMYKQTNGGKSGMPQPQQNQGGQNKDKGQGQGQQGGQNDQITKDSNGQGSFDQHLDPGQGRGKTPNEAIDQRSKVEWEAAATAARHTMKAMGIGSAGLDRIFGQVTTPEYDWKSVLRHAFNMIVGAGRQTWEFLDAEFVIRGIGAPGRRNYGAGFVGIACDSSGSVDQPMMDTFMGHLGVIVDDVRPREILVAQCDDRIHEWEHVQDGSQLKRRVKGGGGTDFRPVFERIAAEGLQPDVLIYFTDCEGRYPETAPSYPVIWACIKENPYMKPTFGELVYIPLQKQTGARHEYA